MTEYTVVVSDIGRHDQGFRGTRTFWGLASWVGAYAELSLYWFLCAYYGRSQVTLLRPSELRNATHVYQTNWLFVGLPTRLAKDELRKIRYNRLALYDSSDFDGVNFDYSDKDLWLSETDLCLKNWRDDRWRQELSIGFLPIKRPPLNNKLHRALQREAAQIKAGQPIAPKEFDVAFVASPAGNFVTNPRLQWLRELKKSRPDLRLWGGLVGGEELRQALRALPEGALLEACWMGRRKISFRTYFAGLQSAKVALAPRGHAPWTYRHYEALYARSIVVSNDLSHYEFLIPMPREGMVEVGKGESVVAAVEQALALYERDPALVERNRAELERWLEAGKYSHHRPATLERFWESLRSPQRRAREKNPARAPGSP